MTTQFHRFIAGKLGAMIASVQESGFKINGLKLLRLTLQEAENFFVAYKGVWNDFQVKLLLDLNIHYVAYIFVSGARERVCFRSVSCCEHSV